MRGESRGQEQYFSGGEGVLENKHFSIMRNDVTEKDLEVDLSNEL